MNAKQYGSMLILVIAAGFAGRFVSSRIFVALLDAQAQGTPQEKLKTTPVQRPQPTLRPSAIQAAPSLGEQVITVPATPGGLAFKMPDGKLLARLNDDRGALFTIYDREGNPSVKLRGWGEVSVSAGRGAITMIGHQIRLEYDGGVKMALTQDPSGGSLHINRVGQPLGRTWPGDITIEPTEAA